MFDIRVEVMSKVCPLCGASEKDLQFYGEFCTKCAAKNISDTMPLNIFAVKCKKCARIHTSSGFKEWSNETAEAVINRKIKPLRFKVKSSDTNILHGVIESESNYGTLRFDADIPMEYNDTVCTPCMRKSSGYYEAVIQLRGTPSRVSQMLGKIEEYFKDNDQFISRILKVDNGIDIYLSSKRTASAFVSKTKIKAVRSYTLTGLRNGKKIYKNTYALHL
jgi:NMD protein affecting ribosome stability and mRNA decay